MERKTPEAHEADVVSRKWLGGFLDINGSVYFTIASPRNTEPYSWPAIRFSEENRGVMERVRSAFGVEGLSIVPSKQDKSNTLTITRHKAADILLSAGPYAPSRKTVARYVAWWRRATTTRERYQAALSYKEAKNREVAADGGDYQRLVKCPQFVAGLIDAKGCPFDFGEAHRVGLRIYSQNNTLLQRLHEQYCGSEPIEGGGTYYWSVESSDYSELLASVWPYLRVYPARVNYLLERKMNG